VTHQRPTEPPPAAIVECTRCHEEVEVLGALSLIGDPFVCILCLSPRLREAKP
jgi:hypothetical protein